MLDIRFVREHLDEVATAMQNRNHTWDSARFQELDESRRASIAKEEELQAKRNAISKSIGKLMGEGKKEEAEATKAKVAELADELAHLEQLEEEYAAEIKKRMGVQTIGHDKLNQMRHVRFLKDADGIAAHMAKHASIIRPKFELVLKMLEEGLAGTGCGSWSNPRGGYFVSFDAPEGTAKHIVAMAKEAGVTMTGAGATYPYKNDPRDSNIRIAPTLPPLEELESALKVFVCCDKLASVEKLLEA